MQTSLFDEDFGITETTGQNKSRGNGTKEAVSRYSNLKIKLDQDPENQNWREVDTSHYDVYDSKKRPVSFLDLFSGAGGISLGFKNAGFIKLFSAEIDKDASQTIRGNFPDSFHYEGYIEKVTGGLLDSVIGNSVVHAVCGGPPCQGFSVAGLRDPHDPRNQLFREFIRVVNHIKPYYVVMENVPGILTMQKGAVYKEIIRQFEEIGYPNMSVRILEAAEFGVPQLRTRAIFIGNRLGLPNPYPKRQFTRAEYRSIESAIDDLKDASRDSTINHEWTAHSKKMECRIAEVPPGGSLYSTFRDAWKRQHRGVPCMTIKENHGGVHIHYEKNRVLSAREMARLQSFPDDYIFSGTTKRAYWQIGNAVPPLLAQSIAIALRTSLESYLEKH